MAGWAGGQFLFVPQKTKRKRIGYVEGNVSFIEINEEVEDWGIFNCSAKKNKEEQFSSGRRRGAPGCDQAREGGGGQARVRISVK